MRMRLTASTLALLACVGCGSRTDIFGESIDLRDQDASVVDGGADASAVGVFLLEESSFPPSAFNPTQGYYSVEGSFAPPPALQSGSSCTTTTAGNCAAFVCVFPPRSVQSSPPLITNHGLNAGTISITGGMDALVLPYGRGSQGGEVDYSSHADLLTPFLRAGTTLRISGSGGADLPAFPAQKVVVPNDVVFTSPACVYLQSCPDVDPATDQLVTWTGGGPGKVVASVFGASDIRSVTISCRFDAAAGVGTVPVALLANLADEDYGLEGYGSENEVHFMVGPVETSFTVSVYASNGGSFKIRK